MRRLTTGIAACGLLGLGAALGWSLCEPAMDARHYGQGRLAAIQQHLDEAPADFVLLAGDSQAELQPPAQRPCGLELVNAGVAGAKAETYANVLDGVRFARRARAALLLIGTNDLIAKNRPGYAANAARFEAAVERILRTLAGHADKVVVAAVPPIGHELDGRLDAGSVAPYTAHLRAVCARLGCRLADPYAALRDGETGFAKPGAMGNGLHLAAYRPTMQALEAEICGP
ncbi:SGNH/GDSL hydrolase family protein [Methylobacterium radiodurans]|uniref:GDSL family lipase n=1 Tax=Methylobacterium radiodurans TaxID=2202828 RepID=A0A2U8VXV3_9HYPH|nr:SGNH/GDSL hydrolase family protein [Methylobacterium radiodurans]AWN38609.1 GDSL family lipase [Methylobacterium radiodurans]